MGFTDPLNGFYRSFEWVLPIFYMGITDLLHGYYRSREQVLTASLNR